MRFATKFLLILIVFAAFNTANAGWKKQSSNTFAWLHAVHFVDANTGWIGGSKGTLLRTSDGGKIWERKYKFTDDTIRDIFFIDKNYGWVLCERNIYSLGPNPPSYLMKTTDGGKSWEKVDFRTSQRRRITSIFFSKGGFGMAVGETGAVFGLQSDKYSWKKLRSPSRYLILDGAFIDDLRGTIVGGGGTIMFTEDAGLSWNQAYVSGKSKSKLNSVFFIDDRTGWVVGSNGKILRTNSGGKFWRPQRSKTKSNLTDVSFISSNEGWAIGENGTILHTTTSGNYWNQIRSRLNHKLEKIFFYGRKGWIVGFGGTILSYEPGNRKNADRPRFRTR